MTQQISLFLLLTLYAFGPGPLLARLFRPLRLSAAERLVVGIGAALFLVYVIGFALFASSLTAGFGPAAHLMIPMAAAALTVLGWREHAQLLRNHQVRRMLLGWLAVFVFGLLLLSCVRNYSGGTWGGDWQEHYERSTFFRFLDPESIDYRFIQQYPLPMRPPMMNVITGNLLGTVASSAAVGADYEAFQLSFFFLNSLVVFPCFVLLPRLVRLSAQHYRRSCWTLVALLAASPVFTQNLTYAWTKLLAAFYALIATAIYLRAMQRWRAGVKNQRPESRWRFVLAFGLLCVGFLVHFSVGPYGLFLGLHYLLAVWWKRPKKVAEAGLIGAASIVVLSTWFAWSIVHYGAKTTFTSTSAVSDSVKMTPAENVANIARNLGNTIVPTILRKPGLVFGPQPPVEPAELTPEQKADTELLTRWDLAQRSAAGKWRDFAFLNYQVSLPLGLGLAGLPIVLYLLWRVISRAETTAAPVRRFWLAFIPVIYVVGTGVYGGVDRFGVAHICLQPMILLGLCLAAGGVWRLSIRWRAVVVVGLVCDAFLGVFLQAAMQHRIFPMTELVTTAPDGQKFLIGYKVVDESDETPVPLVPSRGGQSNLVAKASLGRTKVPLTADLPGAVFWGDRFDGPAALPALLFFSGTLLSGLVFLGFVGLPSRPKTIATATRLQSGRSDPPKRSKSRRR